MLITAQQSLRQAIQVQSTASEKQTGSQQSHNNVHSETKMDIASRNSFQTLARQNKEKKVAKSKVIYYYGKQLKQILTKDSKRTW